MFEPRIHRTAFVPVALAIIVLAFSLTNQAGPLGTNLAPNAFNGQNVANALTSLATRYPDRKPGSDGDRRLGEYVAGQLTTLGFSVSTDQYDGQTASGKRVLTNIVGDRTGLSNSSIAIVADRSSTARPGAAELSSTAMLLELGRVLAGRALQRSVIIASVSGGAGSAGTARLANQLGPSVDAVIVLGDVGGTSTTEPIVLPWSSDATTAPPVLRNTLAAELAGQASLKPGAASLAGQFARLAFPLTMSAQGPLLEAGHPAIELSLAGERGGAGNRTVSQARLTSLGQAVLATASALETGRQIPAPSPYLVYHRLVIGTWSIRLLVLVLILPAFAVGVDGFARARRRGHQIGRAGAWVLVRALPFMAVAAALAGLGVAGALPAAPPGPVGPAAVPIGGTAVAIMIVVGLALLASMIKVDRLAVALSGVREHPEEGAGAVAVLLVMCACGAVMWVTNPFAAALVAPALNIWIWAMAPDLHLRRPFQAALMLVGFVPPVLVAFYYAGAFGLSPAGLAWSAVLMLAGGKLGAVATFEWCVVAGCSLAAVTIGWRLLRRERPQDVPVTVRGPVTYAGPGSLGGTKSAMRR